MAARMAASTVGKTAWIPSPVVLTVVPPCSATASRRMPSCRASAGRIASGCCSQRRVDPSRSVNRNVKVPVGPCGIATPCAAQYTRYAIGRQRAVPGCREHDARQYDNCSPNLRSGSTASLTDRDSSTRQTTQTPLQSTVKASKSTQKTTPSIPNPTTRMDTPLQISRQDLLGPIPLQGRSGRYVPVAQVSTAGAGGLAEVRRSSVARGSRRGSRYGGDVRPDGLL